LILISDVVFAVVAATLSILGLNTLKTIKPLGVGKSFWTLISMSGALFLSGSVIRIFHAVVAELNFSMTVLVMTYNVNEIVQVSWLLALSLLTCSIYTYSRKVKTIRREPIPDERAHDELTPTEEQVKELLRRVEKLKKKVDG